jgi:hypothetical protein
MDKKKILRNIIGCISQREPILDITFQVSTGPKKHLPYPTEISSMSFLPIQKGH